MRTPHWTAQIFQLNNTREKTLKKKKSEFFNNTEKGKKIMFIVVYLSSVKAFEKGAKFMRPYDLDALN